jgi:CheY-like chemotaxis protein
MVLADDAPLQQMMELVLREVLGVVVVANKTGPDALQRVQQAKPAVVVLDTEDLPAALALIRELGSDPITRQIPVIATVASDEECRAAQEAGCAACVRMPFHIDTFIAVVRDHMPRERAATP